MNRDSVNQRKRKNTQQAFPPLTIVALAHGESPDAKTRVIRIVKARKHGNVHEVMGVD